MKLTLSHTVGKRPSKLTPVTLIAVGLMGLSMTAVSWQMIHSQYGRVLLVMLKVCFQIIPPLFWPGGLLLVAIWLVVMARLWYE